MARTALKLGLKPYCRCYYEASNGYEGIEIFKNHKIDIIITDIHMPLLNGLEMIEEIKKIKPQQSFIVITSYDTDENFFSLYKRWRYAVYQKTACHRRCAKCSTFGNI